MYNPHAYVYIIYGCVPSTMQRDFEGGIWMSWQKHSATYQVRWDFKVWLDIEEIQYTVHVWLLDHLRKQSPVHLLYMQLNITCLHTIFIFQMIETSTKHLSFDLYCGFARCAIRELTPKTRNASTNKNQQMTDFKKIFEGCPNNGISPYFDASADQGSLFNHHCDKIIELEEKVASTWKQIEVWEHVLYG